MSKVLVSISPTLDERISETLSQWGFQNKADFFRHAAITYLNEMDRLGNIRKGRFTRIYPNPNL